MMSLGFVLIGLVLWYLSSQAHDTNDTLGFLLWWSGIMCWIFALLAVFVKRFRGF